MLISSNYTLNQEATDKWIISFESGSHFIINTNTVNLLNVLRLSSTMKTAYESYLLHDDFKKGSYNEFEQIAYALIDKLKLDANKQYKAQPSYLTFKVPLIAKSYVAKITTPFSELFSYNLFYLLLSLSFSYNLINLYDVNTESISQYMLLNPVTIFLLLFISTFLHEIGHLSACRKYQAKHGEIGVGFYFIFPVAYSDVTGIWALPKKQRILVNLSGIYLELLYSSILITLSFWYTDLIFVSLMIMTRIAFTLIPFLRNDAYWIASDLLSEPNLLPHAQTLLKSVIIQQRKIMTLTYKERLLFIFAILNTLYFPVFMIYIADTYTNALIDFPANFFSLLTGKMLINDLPNDFFISSMFYFLLSYKPIKKIMYLVQKQRISSKRHYKVVI